MTIQSYNKERIREFWNNRASLGEAAGTGDLIAKQLEIKAIMKYVCNGQHILDVGCGNGATAIEIARQYVVDVVGFDFSEEMVREAKKNAEGNALVGSVHFFKGDILSLPSFHRLFDLIYTERSLINLQDWTTQRTTIEHIAGLLIEGGKFLMCENSQDGLNSINELRVNIGLSKIEPPWHNRYLNDAEVEELSVPGLVLEDVEYFSSTYYFLSRVVNAWLAIKKAKEPCYDHPVNHLALELPPIGKLGQTRLWIWRKEPLE